jgi:hypothetical protein
MQYAGPYVIDVLVVMSLETVDYIIKSASPSFLKHLLSEEFLELTRALEFDLLIEKLSETIILEIDFLLQEFREAFLPCRKRLIHKCSKLAASANAPCSGLERVHDRMTLATADSETMLLDLMCHASSFLITRTI